MPHIAFQRHRRSSFALLLALALLLAQAIGTWHGVSHVLGQAHTQASASDDEAQDDRDGLFGHHDDAAKCLALDALTHLGGACAPAVPLVSLPAAAHAAWQAAEAAARHAALFDARGPPAIR